MKLPKMNTMSTITKPLMLPIGSRRTLVAIFTRPV
jgi:hypothetical protein